MTGVNRRVCKMLARLVAFAQKYPRFFEPDTLAGQAKAHIEAILDKLAAHDASLRRGIQVKMSSGERVKARGKLRACLETISRTARELERREFVIPRGRSDATLISVGKLWAGLIQPMKQKFINSGMSDSFVEKLDAALENLQRVIHDRAFCSGVHLEATILIRQARNEALATLRRLDPIMDNLLRDNPRLFGVWHRARRVERPNRSKPVRTAANLPGSVPA